MNRLWQIENYRSMKITSDENRKQLISDCRGYCKIPVDERENEFYGKIILKGGSLKHFHGQGQGWLETLSLGIGINFIFSAWNQNQLKILESESIYSFDRNLIMAWIRNQFHFCALESESISFFALESELPPGRKRPGPILNTKMHYHKNIYFKEEVSQSVK